MTIKEIDAALEEGQSLKQITQAYSEVANLKIKRIRSEVERNRIFFEEIASVFALIKKLAIKRKVNIVKPKKTVSLIITSNYHFYGTINSDLIDFFLPNTEKLQTDKILIGKVAVDFFRASKKVSNYQQTGTTQEVILKKDQPTAEELVSLVNMIKDYEQVLVFYSSMKSLLTQQPTMTDITASSQSKLELLNAKDNKKDDIRFIFEPEMTKILHFFDSQIITLLLEGTFLESELSRTAARFVSMDQGESEANKFIREYEKLKAYVKRNMDNNKILENFASMAAVRKSV